MLWGDEPQGEAVPRGECPAPDVGGEQEIIGLVQRKAAGVAGGGAEQEATRAVLYSGSLQQGDQRYPVPALDRVPAAGAVERGLAGDAALTQQRVPTGPGSSQ